MAYTPTIGLEVHAELRTRTKMFCECKNDPEEKQPNVNICPICVGHPGALPVINKEAVRHMLRIGTAVGGELADFTEFDRKNYFYPDLPKGYQISQYKYPLVKGGSLEGVELTRIHLEEDTARSMHDQGPYSLIDYNRSSVPLMELVTEPVVHSSEEAVRFAKSLQQLLRHLGAGEANLEKGEMRVEANVSVSKSETLGTKVEVKNLNSFRAVERAIEYEIKRQVALLEKGEKVEQQTRGWDEDKQETFKQRVKEDSHDYRYFPEPDLPKLFISKEKSFGKGVIEASLPELPWLKKERYIKYLKLKPEQGAILVDNPLYANFFEELIPLVKENENLLKLIVNYLLTDIAGFISKSNLGDEASIKELIQPQDYVELMEMIDSGELSSRSGKDILELLLKGEKKPRDIAKEKGLFQSNNESEVRQIAEMVIAEFPEVVKDYKNGKPAALQFLLGQAMKKAKGTANPQKLKESLELTLS